VQSRKQKCDCAVAPALKEDGLGGLELFLSVSPGQSALTTLIHVLAPSGSSTLPLLRDKKRVRRESVVLTTPHVSTLPGAADATASKRASPTADGQGDPGY
jgi:hypothetical protein